MMLKEILTEQLETLRFDEAKLLEMEEMLKSSVAKGVGVGIGGEGGCFGKC